MQVTANSLTGFWGARSQNVAEWLVKRKAVHVIASDAHDPTHRKPVLSDARARIADLSGDVVADALVNLNPAAIVEGNSLPYHPQY